MQLERIQVEGFKSIRELDLELRPLNVLIGANGSGKTNFIGVFHLLSEMLQQRLQVYTGSVGADSLLYYGAKTTQQISLELSFAMDKPDWYNGYSAVLAPTDQETLFFVKETAWMHNRNIFTHPRYDALGGGHRETQLFELSASSPDRRIGVDYIIGALARARVYHFHDTSRQAGIKQRGPIDDNASLRPDASNLAAFLYRLEAAETAYYERIVRTIRLVAPFFDDFDLRPAGQDPDKIRLEWREQGSDTYFNAHSLSDGTLRFMCLATLFLQPQPPAVILIDEPELGLHPYAIALLANLIESAAERSQVIVSTQSVTLINQFAPEDVIVVDRSDEQSVFRRLEADVLAEWLEVYGLGELWEKNIIGGRPQHPERSI